MRPFRDYDVTVTRCDASGTSLGQEMMVLTSPDRAGAIRAARKTMRDNGYTALDGRFEYHACLSDD